MGAQTRVGQLTDQRLVHQCLIDGSGENCIIQFNLANLRPGHILDRQHHNIALLIYSCDVLTRSPMAKAW
jgi:hypothetical protein